MVKTDFQTQSLQQSIFPWQGESVETGIRSYEESNISISLFNSYWQAAYVSLGTGWNHCEWATGGFQYEEMEK